jgi:hypothetical protein
MEAELFALSQGIRVVAWMRCLLMELQLLAPSATTNVLCDNKAALDRIKDNAGQTLQKHIDIRLKHIQERVLTKEINPLYISSTNNKADWMTKYLEDGEHSRQLSRAMHLLPEEYRV